MPASIECAGVALALAVGTTSITFFLWRFAGAPVRIYPHAETTALLIVAGMCLYLWRPLTTPDRSEISTTEPIAFRIIAVGIMFVIVWSFARTVWERFIEIPHGEWDAWAMWNMRAAFLATPSSHWADGFTLELGWAPPDYPLLVPASVARLWTYAGELTPAGPMVFATEVCAATVLIVGAALLRVSGYLGTAVGLSLLLVPGYAWWVTSQCADVALALYLVMAVSLLSRRRDLRRLTLAGVAIGFAAWSKNEGTIALLAIAACYVAVVLARHGRSTALRSAVVLAGGVLPVLAVLVAFKLLLAPSSTFVAGMTNHPLQRLADLGRHQMVVSYMAMHVADWGGWKVSAPLWFVLAWLALGFAKWRTVSDAALTATLVVVIMLSSYYVVYVLTTQPMPWQMQVSWGRLVAQVWPTLVWSAAAAGLSVKSLNP